MRESDALVRQIDALYLAFADAAVPQHIDACPCCLDDKRVCELQTTPLRAIPPDVLAPYAASALLTVGSVSDYLYFLPRIVEVSVQEASWWPSIEVTAGKIVRADFESWHPGRRSALAVVVSAAFDEFLQIGSYASIDEWLCAVGILGLDVHPYLQKLEGVPQAVLHYFEDNEQCLKRGGLCNSFWELPNAAHDEITRWFSSDPIREILFQAYGWGLPASRPGDENNQSR